MARPPVPSIYFDADEILATHGVCLKNLNKHIEEVRHAPPPVRRSLKSVARMAIFAGVAALSGYVLTAAQALPIAS